MAKKYLDYEGTAALAERIKSNISDINSLTGALAVDHSTGMRYYATETAKPAALDVENGVLIATGEYCCVIETRKFYKATVNSETNAITWRETSSPSGQVYDIRETVESKDDIVNFLNAAIRSGHNVISYSFTNVSDASIFVDYDDTVSLGENEEFVGIVTCESSEGFLEAGVGFGTIGSDIYKAMPRGSADGGTSGFWMVKLGGLKVVELTSAEYQALVDADEMDPEVLYLLTDSDVPGRNPDTEMSSTSTNVVQNKVIKAYVDAQITALKEELIALINSGAGSGVSVSETAPSDTTKLWVDTGSN